MNNSLTLWRNGEESIPALRKYRHARFTYMDFPNAGAEVHLHYELDRKAQPEIQAYREDEECNALLTGCAFPIGSRGKGGNGQYI